mgnify:CR=1 FL=1
MNKKLLFIVPALTIAGITFMSNSNEKIEKFHKDGFEIANFSSNPNLGLTGAPGEGNCTQCHNSSTAQSAVGNVSLTAPNEYIVGQTYLFEIGMTTNANNGFEMTILDGNDNKAGSFTAGTSTSVATQSGREYIRQTAKSGFWTFNWTAPNTNMGDLTAYYVVNKSNNNGSNQLDTIYLGQQIITSALTNGISEYEKQDKKIKMFFNEANAELNVKYNLNKKSRILIQIHDLSGRLVDNYEIGMKSMGGHTEKLKMNEIQSSGIYFVSIFVNNNVYSRKIHLK